MSNSAQNPYSSPAEASGNAYVRDTGRLAATIRAAVDVALVVSIIGAIGGWYATIVVLTGGRAMPFRLFNDEFLLAWTGTGLVLAGTFAGVFCAAFGRVIHRIVIAILVLFYLPLWATIIPVLWQKVIAPILV